MKTQMIISLATTMTLMLILASCSPSSSNNSAQSFQATDPSSNHIIGGAESTAEFQKANGVVGLLIVFETKDGNQGAATCSGSAITPTIVVTAAHCLVLPEDAKSFVAALVILETDFSKALEEFNNKDLSHVRVVTNAKRHENYLRGRGTDNDIGLVSFQDALPADFQLAQLASPQLERTIRKGDLVTLAGFGVSKYKMNPVTHEPEGSGDGLLRQIEGIRVVSLTATGEEITLDQSQGSGACHGDSGGPAYLKDAVTGKNILIGVTSRGTNPQGLCNQQVIYTGVMGYADWIQKGLQELQVKSETPQPSTEPTSTQLAAQ